MGPKVETTQGTGMRYDARDHLTQGGHKEWSFEEWQVSLLATEMLLVRIMIAKIENQASLENILRSVPLRQGEPGWNCVGWVKEALQLLMAGDKVLGANSVVEWKTVRDIAMSYCQQKRIQHRFDGKGDFDTEKPATYDLLQEKEVIC